MISDDLLLKIEGQIHANRCGIRELHHIISEVSMTTIHEAVTEKLGYRKLCTCCVPKMLTDDHVTKQMGFALKFLTCYAQEGDEFLDSIVTGDKTWVFYHTPESKQVTAMAPYTFPYDGTHLTFGRTLDRCSHFKHISLKQSQFYHCQTSTAHRQRIKVNGSVVTLSIKNFLISLHMMYLYFLDTGIF
jgi:hypothetical protein